MHLSPGHVRKVMLASIVSPTVNRQELHHGLSVREAARRLGISPATAHPLAVSENPFGIRKPNPLESTYFGGSRSLPPHFINQLFDETPQLTTLS